jgi:hypothetical protein
VASSETIDRISGIGGLCNCDSMRLAAASLYGG